MMIYKKQNRVKVVVSVLLVCFVILGFFVGYQNNGKDTIESVEQGR